jgi:hypothetical protein
VEGMSFSRGLCSSRLSRPKPARLVSQTGLTGCPVGCREGFLSKEVSVALWLLLFICGKALEVFWVFGEFLDKVGLTGLPNRSDRFLLPA